MKILHVLIGVLFLSIFLVFIFRHTLRKFLYEQFITQVIYDPSVEQMDTERMQKLHSYLLFDCREPEEFEVSHIENAILFGFQSPKFFLVEELSPKDSIVLYCSVGHRSQIIAKKLSQMGFQNVFNLSGGIFQWIYEDKEIYRGGQITPKIHAYSPKWGALLSKGEKVY